MVVKEEPTGLAPLYLAVNSDQSGGSVTHLAATLVTMWAVLLGPLFLVLEWYIADDLQVAEPDLCEPLGIGPLKHGFCVPFGFLTTKSMDIYQLQSSRAPNINRLRTAVSRSERPEPPGAPRSSATGWSSSSPSTPCSPRGTWRRLGLA